ncbi:CORD and CS containing protein [Coleophoma crateriformis]|uniref:CORD and CS containing protein n=1 Tax=Coleophoma crateriformis TaxID=565419 RepID=A0A3D8SHL7_9HELO|nr:CORD and CS containing protein [Coleophoma crateriformis]
MAQKCVHQSCGKLFSEAEEGECHYHPGPPIFHEGQKGWKCCKPRVLTFDEFLSIPPCTTGKHSTTDIPPTLEKKAAEAPDPSIPVTKPTAQVSSASNAPVAAPTPTATPPPPPPESESDDASLEVPKGRICRRKACGFSYEGQTRDNEKCVFHPGVPIFHEGSKGYTCCKRRVLEFDEFMKIEGCKTKNRHLFIGSGKKEGAGASGGEEILETVRHDFYQTQTTVITSFFLKKINKDAAKIEFASQQVSLDLPTSDSPPKRYKAVVPLFGAIDPTASTFKVMGTKLEVTFVKADGASWPVLRSDEARTGEIIQVGRAGRAL